MSLQATDLVGGPLKACDSAVACIPFAHDAWPVRSLQFLRCLHCKNLLEELGVVEGKRDWDVRVLFAIESGSRARGFASPDSDCDARFESARVRMVGIADRLLRDERFLP